MERPCLTPVDNSLVPYRIGADASLVQAGSTWPGLWTCARQHQTARYTARRRSCAPTCSPGAHLVRGSRHPGLAVGNSADTSGATHPTSNPPDHRARAASRCYRTPHANVQPPTGHGPRLTIGIDVRSTTAGAQPTRHPRRIRNPRREATQIDSDETVHTSLGRQSNTSVARRPG